MREDQPRGTDLPKRVLYVEDNAMDADLVRRALAAQAPQTALDIVSTLAEAMERLAPAAPEYELVLSDLRLPDGNGMELLAHVRERRLPVAVVILTGGGDQDAAIAALKAGADDYVVKRAAYANRLIPTLSAALARFRSEFANKARALRVLYAEHNLFDIDLTRRHFALNAPQIRLHTVDTGDGVLAELPATGGEPPPYDVVLLDYQLPGINALEIVKMLRDERSLDVPVVLVTGQGSEDVVAEALRLGVADYVVKHPGYLGQLPAILEHAHRQAQLIREQARQHTTAERLRQLLAANPTILYAQHVDGTRLTPQWISENVTRVYGYSVDECLQPDWWLERLHPDDRERVQAERQRLFAEHSLTQEYRFRDKEGTVLWVRDDMRLLLDAAGKPATVVGSWSDISERKESEAELQRFTAELERQVEKRTAELRQSNEALLHSNEELQRFAYVASHDLQTPLRTVVGLAQLFQSLYGSRLDDQAGELIGRMVEAGRHMQTLVQDLLAYSRVDSQARPFKPTDLNLVLKGVLDTLKEPIREAGAEVIHGDLPTVSGDPVQLTQLLQNLIENGLKYRGPELPKVEVWSERQGNEWILSVRDNGIGIDPRHHEAIFEIFRRLHTQQAYPGTGIGLAICRRVVERHGGRIWAESAPGQGSVFRFTFPERQERFESTFEPPTR